MKSTKSTISHSLAETENLAKEWLGSINARESADKATIIALNGDLGSGKTTFVQAVARSLGVTGNVTSPTFVIMKKYKLASGGSNNGGFTQLIHIDAYRLEDGADLNALEFADIVADPGNLVLIEWANNVKSGLPADIEKIDFEYVGENERKISF